MGVRCACDLACGEAALRGRRRRGRRSAPWSVGGAYGAALGLRGASVRLPSCTGWLALRSPPREPSAEASPTATSSTDTDTAARMARPRGLRRPMPLRVSSLARADRLPNPRPPAANSSPARSASCSASGSCASANSSLGEPIEAAGLGGGGGSGPPPSIAARPGFRRRRAGSAIAVTPSEAGSASCESGTLSLPVGSSPGAPTYSFTIEFRPSALPGSGS
jgi:hypothetical protein